MSAGSIEAGKAHVRVQLKEDLSPGVAKVKAQLQVMSRTFREVGSVLGTSGLKLTAVFGGLLGSLALPVKLAADAERTAASFETMTGSVGAAKAVLTELKKFAAQTPFEFPELSDAAKKLLSFGSNTSEVVNELRRIGDVASGIGVPIGELAEIYGKARVQGRLFAEDINQLQGRGINVTKEFAKQFGVAETEVRKLTESGQIGFKNLEQAIFSLTSTNGTFAGGMARQSKTLIGLFSTLTDNIKSAVLPIGEALLPALARFTAQASEVAAAVGGWVERNKELIPGIAAIAAGGTGLGVVLTGLDIGLTLTSSLLTSLANVTGLAGKAYAKLTSVFATSATANSLATKAIATSAIATGAQAKAATLATVANAANAVAAKSVATASGAMAFATVYAARGFDKLTASVIAFRGAMVATSGAKGAGVLIGAVGSAATFSTKPVALLTSNLVAASAATATTATRSSLLVRAFAAIGTGAGSIATAIGSFFGSVPGAVALAIAAAGAGALYVANKAGLLVPTFNFIKAGAIELAAVVKKAFGGISNALNAGEYLLAAKILVAGLKVEFLTGVKIAIETVSSLLRNFTGIALKWSEALLTTIAETFQKIPSIIQAVITGNKTIAQIIADAITGNVDGVVARSLASASAELDKLVAEANQKSAALTKQQQAANAQQQQQTGNGQQPQQQLMQRPMPQQVNASVAVEKQATTATQDRIAALRQEIEVMRIGADLAERRKAMLEGATQAELQALAMLQQKRNQLQAFAALKDEATNLKESLLTPLEDYRNKLERINQMRAANLISEEQRAAAIAKLQAGFTTEHKAVMATTTAPITGMGAAMLQAIRPSLGVGENKTLSRDQLREAIKQRRELEKLNRKPPQVVNRVRF